MSDVNLTLSREQAALLLPLLPALQQHMREPSSATEQGVNTNPNFSNADMFRKKKKNTTVTPAQNYLLTIVREAARAANIWDTAPLLKEITPAASRKFYEVALTLCPQLASCRHLLTSRLSQTLINRRQFLRRKKRISTTPCKTPNASEVRDSHSSAGKEDSQHSADENSQPPSSQSDSSWPPVAKVADAATSKASKPTGKEALHPGNVVVIKDATDAPIGKGILWRMNSQASYEVFGKVLFQSARRGIDTTINLPSTCEKGATSFCELERGDIFLWRVSRLQLPAAGHIKTLSSNLPRTDKAQPHEDESMEREDERMELEEDEEYMSEYEKKRMQRIRENKRKLSEIFDDTLTPEPKCKQLRRPETPRPEVGEFVAFRCEKYQEERPLIGRVINAGADEVTVDWYVGTYSGTWREWKGRSEGKTVTYTEYVPAADIVLRNITFTKSKRLSPSTVAALKKLY